MKSGRVGRLSVAIGVACGLEQFGLEVSRTPYDRGSACVIVFGALNKL
jgi:hypothetical protein